MVKHWFTSYLTSYYSQNQKLGLDIGSGRKNWREFCNCNMIGIDLNDTLLNTKELRPEVCASADSLPFAENSFDFVMCYSVLSYIPDIDKTLDDVHRVLKSNGVAVFIVINNRGMKLHPNIDWIHKLNSKNLIQKLKEHNFQSIKKKNLKSWIFSTYYDLTSVYAYAIVHPVNK